MTPVFADTSFYLALFSRDDAWHQKALRWSEADTRPVILTEFVLIELGNALSRGQARPFFVDLVKWLRRDEASEIVPATPELVEDGLRLFAQRPDKDWSLTDCISFVVMGHRHLSDALTADSHFEQAGFNALLR